MKYLYLLIALSLTACGDYHQTSDEKLSAQQENLMQQATNAVGMPGIHKFSEKLTLKSIYELRDRDVATYTYVVSLNNELKLLCHSVGYGIPYATQYTNPQKMEHPYSGIVVTMPQADPNGLFSPASADGTWILCLNPETKLASPLYVEPRVIVSQFKLK